MPALNLKRVKLLTDFIVLSGGQLLSKVFGFLAFGYLARTLGPHGYGTVEYAVGLAAFSSMVVEFGLGPIGVRELAGSSDKLSLLAANIPFARILIVASCLPVMLGAAFLSHRDASAAQLVMLYAVSLAAAPWNLDWLFQARDMMTRSAIAQVLRMGTFAAGVFLFVSSSDHVLRVGMLEVSAAAIATVYYLWTQQTRITPISFRLSVREVRALLKEGLPIGGAQMASAVNMFAPLFLVANLVGGEQTGWFAACHRLVISLSTFSQVYHFNLYPVLAKRVFSKADDLIDVVRASFRVVTWFSFAGSLGLFVLSPVVMQVAFGDAFVAASGAFRVLVWFLPITLLSGHARWLLVAVKQQRLAFTAQVAGAITTVGVSCPLVAFGHLLSVSQATGAAIGMLLAALAVWTASHFAAARFLGKLPGLSLTLTPALVAAVLAIGASSLRITPWLTAPAAGALFLAMGPVVDRQLLPDLRRLMRSKSS